MRKGEGRWRKEVGMGTGVEESEWKQSKRAYVYANAMQKPVTLYANFKKKNKTWALWEITAPGKSIEARGVHSIGVPRVSQRLTTTHCKSPVLQECIPPRYVRISAP